VSKKGEKDAGKNNLTDWKEKEKQLTAFPKFFKQKGV